MSRPLEHEVRAPARYAAGMRSRAAILADALKLPLAERAKLVLQLTESLKKRKESKRRSSRVPTPEEIGYRSSTHGHEPIPIPLELIRARLPRMKGKPLSQLITEMRRERP